MSVLFTTREFQNTIIKELLTNTDYEHLQNIKMPEFLRLATDYHDITNYVVIVPRDTDEAIVLVSTRSHLIQISIRSFSLESKELRLDRATIKWQLYSDGSWSTDVEDSSISHIGFKYSSEKIKDFFTYLMDKRYDL